MESAQVAVWALEILSRKFGSSHAEIFMETFSSLVGFLSVHGAHGIAPSVSLTIGSLWFVRSFNLISVFIGFLKRSKNESVDLRASFELSFYIHGFFLEMYLVFFPFVILFATFTVMSLCGDFGQISFSTYAFVV